MVDDESLREAGELLIKQADAMAEAESSKDMASGVLRLAVNSLVGIFFGSDIDFLTKLLIVVSWCSLIFMFVYLAMPMTMRRKFETLDFDPKVGGHVSISGACSILAALMLGITKMQKTTYAKSAEEKVVESYIEREFRLRQSFMSDIHTYQFVLLLGVWLTINFIFKVNRDRERYQAIIEGRDMASSQRRNSAASENE